MIELAQRDSQEIEESNYSSIESSLKKDKLQSLFSTFLVDRRNLTLRQECVEMIYWIWKKVRWEHKNQILESCFNVLPLIPSYGISVDEFMALLSYFVHRIGIACKEDSPQRDSLIATRTNCVSTIIEVFKVQNRALLNHPNSHIYESLNNYIQVSGYYLESDPCLACNFPEPPFTETTLESIKSEIKYTDSSMTIRFVQRFTLQSLTLNISDLRQAKMVRSIEFYYNNKTVGDINDLKNKHSLWKLVGSRTLSKAQTHLVFTFDTPIDATNFMITFSSFYENATATERLTCPRCNRVVSDRHGICRNCHENAFQCRHCRNINYENLHGFLCIDCGYCSYGKFILTFMSKASYAVDLIETESDEKKCLNLIEKDSKAARLCVQQLQALKRPLEQALSGFVNKKDKDLASGDKIATLSEIYTRECRALSEGLSKLIKTLSAARKELLRYSYEIKRISKRDIQDISGESRGAYTCYGCLFAFAQRTLQLLGDISRDDFNRSFLVSHNCVEEILDLNLRRGGIQGTEQAIEVLCSLVEDNREGTNRLHSVLKKKINFFHENLYSLDVSNIGPEVTLLTRLALVEDTYWEERLKIVFELFFLSIEKGSSNPLVLDKIILPSLSVIVQLCTPIEPKSGEKSSENLNFQIPHQEKAPPISYHEWKSSPRTESPQIITELTVTESSNAPNGHLTPPHHHQTSTPTFKEWVDKMGLISESDSQIDQTQNLARKYFNKWRANIKKRRKNSVPQTSPIKSLFDSNWVTRLLLNPVSQPIRHQTVKLIRFFFILFLFLFSFFFF